ncbi:RNA polymerase sigma factor [Marseilla massiliensis]|uniref:RNA polymerase sigma factor n=1 Tax=Marseilla massiliensis TaxID=1841864 RepID=A0A939B772_9BACT|nr:RNA polymerase sigma factor [Marseilla massiliensis]MBM6673242.1 RNA polymerase sigma factor [Marseilla massiliensis]CCY65408.1 sigma-70 family RNA polymerase sigma factor [Prevotella sp. CAG:1124]
MQVAMTGEEFKRRFLPLSRKLYGVALSLSGDMQEAEDIVQDVYTKLWTRRDRLPSDVNDEAYCVVVTKNVYNDRLRGRGSGMSFSHELPAQIPSRNDVVGDIENRNLADIMRRCIAALPEQQRELVVMRDVNGAGYDEISYATGLSMANIRVTLSRARKTLREQFNAIRNYGNK